MSLKKISFVVLASLAFASVGMAHGNKQACNTTINFDKGQDQLTQSAKDSLKKLVDTATAQGQIATVEVAAWSDEPFPARNQDLSKADRDLAASRADQIQSYLRNALNVANVKTFNMAESSNWLSRALRTDSAELKSVFSKDEAPVMSRSDFNVIRKNGGVSKAAVVVSKKKVTDIDSDTDPADIN